MKVEYVCIECGEPTNQFDDLCLECYLKEEESKEEGSKEEGSKNNESV